MVRLEGGAFRMGSDRHYIEEAPSRTVVVDPFWIDQGPVTNAQFARFVEATGHVTAAEQAPDPKDYPGMPTEMAHAGSIVFTPTKRPVPLTDPSQWWRFVFGADWRHPAGPGSGLLGLEQHPVAHVAFADAEAFAAWAGKVLPTEAEWEFACRGGLDGAAFAWGEELTPGGRRMANYWVGEFPSRGPRPRNGVRTTPIGRYPPNGFGNVWEWTADWYGLAEPVSGKPCCVPRNPRGASALASRDPAAPGQPIGRKVLKGGSHLCAASYCQRYRPAARHPQPIDTSTSHVGFRCVVRG